jgi:hypothetical protein
MFARAREVISYALALAEKSEDREVQLCVGIESARTNAVLGDTQTAERQLLSIISKAKEYHYFGYEMQARLLLGQLETKGPDAAKGWAHLAALARVAAAKRFGLIVNAIGKGAK